MHEPYQLASLPAGLLLEPVSARSARARAVDSGVSGGAPAPPLRPRRTPPGLHPERVRGFPGAVSTILVAIDFSKITRRLLEEAALLAGAMQARITLVHVIPDDPDLRAMEVTPEGREAVIEHLRAAKAELQQLADGLRRRRLVAGAKLLRGDPLEVLVGLTQQEEVVRVVVGSHGKSATTRQLVGSASESLVRGAGCPILVVPSRLES